MSFSNSNALNFFFVIVHMFIIFLKQCTYFCEYEYVRMCIVWMKSSFGKLLLLTLIMRVLLFLLRIQHVHEDTLFFNCRSLWKSIPHRVSSWKLKVKAVENSWWLFMHFLWTKPACHTRALVIRQRWCCVTKLVSNNVKREF